MRSVNNTLPHRSDIKYTMNWTIQIVYNISLDDQPFDRTEKPTKLNIRIQ